jgi:hypothetical protein
MAPKRTCQEFSEFYQIWLAKCKKNRGYSFQQCREAFGKSSRVTQANDDEAYFCEVFLLKIELKKCKSDNADA